MIVAASYFWVGFAAGVILGGVLSLAVFDYLRELARRVCGRARK